MSKTNEIRAVGFLGRLKARRTLAKFRQCQRLEPHNPRWPHKIAELEVRVGELEAAKASYRQAADLYLAKGHAHKARALDAVLQSIVAESQSNPRQARTFART